MFYPWRAFDFLKVAAQWLWLVRRYRRMTARVIADPAAANYVDVALSLHTGSGDRDHFVEVFADKNSAYPRRA